MASLSQERAEAVAALARKHQKGQCSSPQPLSLLDMSTPPGDSNVTDDEILLRKRAAELGDSYGENVATYDAILEICQTLLKEDGFDRIARTYDCNEWIEEKLEAIHCRSP